MSGYMLGGKERGLTGDIIDYVWQDKDPYDSADRLRELAEEVRKTSTDEDEGPDDVADELDEMATDLEGMLDRISAVLNDEV